MFIPLNGVVIYFEENGLVRDFCTSVAILVSIATVFTQVEVDSLFAVELSAIDTLLAGADVEVVLI